MARSRQPDVPSTSSPERRSYPSLLIFNSEKLFDPFAFDHANWQAISGPWGNGNAPSGVYLVGPRVEIEAGGNNEPFTDAAGLAWWAGLTPKFKTDRTRLGIHPDGNVPGTRGCIGVTEPITAACFNWLVELADPLYLVVLPA